MQIRSCAIWLGVVGLIATASPALAAPKHKKAKKAASAEVTPEPPAEKERGSGVDDLMGESTKRKPAASSSRGDVEPEPAADEPSGEPDAWERPPVEQEKPKKLAPMVVEEKKGDGRNIDVGITLGWGTQTTKFFADDPYGFGFGLRGAYELSSHIVIGVGAEYLLGHGHTAVNAAGVSVGGTTATSANYFLVHGEFGYNVWLDSLIVRPSIWAGLSIGTQNPPIASGTSGVVTAFTLAPGLTLHYLLGTGGWFIGADARINLLLGEGTSGILLFATLGHRF